MSNYKIEFSNRSKAPIYIKPDTFNYITTITMCGFGAELYGESLWTDVVRRLENWSNELPPEKALEGQLWYDNKNKSLNLNTGVRFNHPKWDSITGASLSTTGFLNKNGGALKHNLIITDPIVLDTQLVTRQYIIDNKLKSTGVNSTYQYNIMPGCNIMTFNGVIPYDSIKGGDFTVTIPKVMMGTDYSVCMSISSKDPAYVNTVIKQPGPVGHHYYVADKTINSFKVVIGGNMIKECDVQFMMIGEIHP